MPHTCPVCLTVDGVIRADAKTCSRHCAKTWNKMTQSEQQARLRALNPQSQVDKLKAQVFPTHPEVIDNEDAEIEPEAVIEEERKFPLDILTKS